MPQAGRYGYEYSFDELRQNFSSPGTAPLSGSFQDAARTCEESMRKWAASGFQKLASRLNLDEPGMNRILMDEINQAAQFGTARYPAAARDTVFIPGPQHLYPLAGLDLDLTAMKYQFMLMGEMMQQQAMECINLCDYFRKLAAQGIEFFDSPVDIYAFSGAMVAHEFIAEVLAARDENRIIHSAPAIASYAGQLKASP